MDTSNKTPVIFAIAFSILLLPQGNLADVRSSYCNPYYHSYGCPTPTPTPPPDIHTYCSAGPSAGYRLDCETNTLQLSSHITPDVSSAEYMWSTTCPASLSDSGTPAPQLSFGNIDRTQGFQCSVALKVHYPTPYYYKSSYYSPPKYLDTICSAPVSVPVCTRCEEIDIENDVLILDIAARDAYLVIRKISIRTIRNAPKRRLKRRARELRRLARENYQEIWSLARSLNTVSTQCTGNTVNCITISYVNVLTTISSNFQQLDEISGASAGLLRRATGRRGAGTKLLSTAQEQIASATLTVAGIPQTEIKCF